MGPVQPMPTPRLQRYLGKKCRVFQRIERWFDQASKVQAQSLCRTPVQRELQRAIDPHGFDGDGLAHGFNLRYSAKYSAALLQMCSSTGLRRLAGSTLPASTSSV